MDLMVTKDRRVIKVSRENQEMTLCLDLMELMEKMDFLELMVSLAKMELLVSLELTGLRDLMVPKETKVLPERMLRMEQLVNPDLKEPKEPKENTLLMAPMDLTESRETREKLVLRVTKAIRALQEKMALTD